MISYKYTIYLMYLDIFNCTNNLKLLPTTEKTHMRSHPILIICITLSKYGFHSKEIELGKTH